MVITRSARHETVAAFTAVAILAPETVAFAQIAGIPPAQGLAAAPLCVLAYAVLGRSRRLIVGATAATAVISSAAVLGRSEDPKERAQLAIALSILTGLLLVLTGLLRCGFVARFLTPEALQGFLFGLAVVILIRQLAVMVDVHTRTGDVFVRAWDIGAARADWNIPSLATGLACLAALLVLETWVPKIPATIAVLIVAALTYAGLHLQRHGVQHVVDVPSGWPRLALPDISAGQWTGLLPTAAGLALIVFVLGHGVGDQLRDPDERSGSANREMTGLGLANVIAGVLGAASVSGSPSASSAARTAGGGRSHLLPGLVTALLLLVGLFLTPVFRFIPEPALAAIVIMAVRPFLGLGPMRKYLRHDRRSLAISLTAVLGVVTFTLVPGLLIAVLLSLLIFVADASQLRISELGLASESGAYLAVERFPDVVTPKASTILRPDGQLFFANSERLATAIDAELARPEHAHYALILDLGASFELRSAVVDVLADMRRRVDARGRPLRLVHLYLAAQEAISAGPLADVPAFRTLDEAVLSAVQTF